MSTRRIALALVASIGSGSLARAGAPQIGGDTPSIGTASPKVRERKVVVQTPRPVIPAAHVKISPPPVARSNAATEISAAAARHGAIEALASAEATRAAAWARVKDIESMNLPPSSLVEPQRLLAEADKLVSLRRNELTPLIKAQMTEIGDAFKASAAAGLRDMTAWAMQPYLDPAGTAKALGQFARAFGADAAGTSLTIRNRYSDSWNEDPVRTLFSGVLAVVAKNGIDKVRTTPEAPVERPLTSLLKETADAYRAHNAREPPPPWLPGWLGGSSQPAR